MPLVSPSFLARLRRGNPQHPVSGPADLASPPANQEVIQSYMGWPCDYTRALSESPGVDLSSCEVNGDPHNRECLPILPAGCTSLYSSIVDSQTSRQDTQAQSPFFTDLLPQIRQLIYICLFGNRRTHLEFDCRSKQARWLWWHRVCDSPDKCPDKEFICPENATAEAMMLHLGSKPREMEGTEAKVDGIGWFSCCKLVYSKPVPFIWRLSLEVDPANG